MKKSFISNKIIAIISSVTLLLSMIPIIMASFYNRATADDYAFSEFTRRAWMHTGSLLEVLKAGFEKVHEMYLTWQGTWFDVFLFSMQPEAFSDSAYWVGNLITVLLFVSSFAILMYWFMVKVLGTDRSTFVFSTSAFLLLFYQFVPDKHSSIFWFNGCAHYMIPTAIAFLGVALIIKYSINHKTSTLIWISIIYTILGGVNYLTSIFSILLLLYVVFDSFFLERKSGRKIFLLFIPMTLEIIGLLISALAPGNSGREDIPFSFKLFISSIGLSFKAAFKDMISRLIEYPYLSIVVIAFAVIVFLMFRKQKQDNRPELNTKVFQKPLIFTIVTYLIYTAVYWPEMFAQTSVSSGVYDTYFMMFYLMIFVDIIYWCGWITAKWPKKKPNFEIKSNIILIGIAVLVVVIPLLFFRSYIKESTDYRCYNFVASGRASQYKEKMDRQTRLLEDLENSTLTLPIIGDDVDPLFLMSISREKEAWANVALCRFYEKEAVYGVSEEEWIQMNNSTSQGD